jgi:hypothetical protein
MFKTVAVALAAIATLTATAAAQHECDKVVRVDRISSNQIGASGTWTYELIVSNLVGNMVQFKIESGEFPKGVTTPGSKSVTIAPRGNLHIPFGRGNVSLDNVKKQFFYDVRHSLPQGWVLVTDCVQASAR